MKLASKKKKKVKERKKENFPETYICLKQYNL